MLVFFFLVIVLIILQDLVAIGTAGILHLDPLMGMCTGSIPMLGGHGTAAAFGKILEQKGLNGATTVCMAAATYGLIAGSLMGGPLANRLIQKNHLQKTDETKEIVPAEILTHRKFSEHYAPAAFQLAAAAGIGTIFSALLSRTGMTFPAYIGAMIAAALVRNLAEYSGKFQIHTGEIEDIGGIMLSLFLGIAMIRLRIWDLADLAFPLLVLLAVQTVFMLLFVRFVVFRAMGRDYDAAVIGAGTCGFGMGATPNAMANMQAVTKKFGSSLKAFIIIPIVGSLFADFCNSMVIAFFINLF